MTEQENLYIPYPIKEIFKNKGMTAIEQVESETIYVMKTDKNRGVEYPESGGIYHYCEGAMLPEKGFVYPEAMQAVNLAKRVFISQIRFFIKHPSFLVGFIFKPIKKINDWLKEFVELCDGLLQAHFLEDKRYTEISQELNSILKYFLVEIGIKEEIAITFALIFSHIIQIDQAYRYRLEDLFTEAKQENLIKNPTKEIKRLLEIFCQRELRVQLREKFKHFGIALRILFLYPGIKKSFIRTIKQSNFKKLQFDDIDYHSVLPLQGYNFFGKNIETRWNEYVKMYNGNIPKWYALQWRPN